MKKMMVLVFAAAIFASCSTVSSLVPGGVSLPSAVSGVQSSGALKGAVDFRDGEVLCAAGTDPYHETYYVARVLTQASAATKNQAEVVYVNNGRKEWVNFIIPSVKAGKDSFSVGKVVLVPFHRQQQKDIDADDYRKTEWGLGRVTSLDEMFKDIIEVDGHKYFWQFVRIPNKEP